MSIASVIAPSGTLRAAINFGNAILAQRDATGAPAGVTVDLAREIARRLDLPLAFVPYEGAGKVVAGAEAGEWDIAFVAIDPERGRTMHYTPPYVVIEGAYMVPDASPVRSNADVDRAGTRIVVGKGSAYDLYLTRAITKAELVRAPSSQTVVDTMLAQGCEVAANVRQQLQADCSRLQGQAGVPAFRILDEPFMAIHQAMALPKGHADTHTLVLPWLCDVVEELKTRGVVAQALERHGIRGATVAPAGMPANF